MRGWIMALALLAAGPAQAQGVPGTGALGGVAGGVLGGLLGQQQQQQTPEQKRAFCQRAAGAATRCAGQAGLALDTATLTACLIRTLPPEDSMRVAQVANATRGNAMSLLSECGITTGR